MAGELKIIQPIEQMDGVGMTVVVEINGKRTVMAADKIVLLEDGSIEGTGFPFLGIGKMIVPYEQEKASILLKPDGRHVFKGSGSRKFVHGNGEPTPINPRSVWVSKSLGGGE